MMNGHKQNMISMEQELILQRQRLRGDTMKSTTTEKKRPVFNLELVHSAGSITSTLSLG